MAEEFGSTENLNQDDLGVISRNENCSVIVICKSRRKPNQWHCTLFRERLNRQGAGGHSGKAVQKATGLKAEQAEDSLLGHFFFFFFNDLGQERRGVFLPALKILQ